MKEIEFNLLTEPWIRVRLRDNTVREVSLTEALVSAQDYVDLAGEMPTQNAAVLRLLLAVLFTVFSRLERAVAAGAFSGGACPGLSGAVEGPLLAIPPDTPLLAGAAGKDRHGIRCGQTQR